MSQTVCLHPKLLHLLNEVCAEHGVDIAMVRGCHRKQAIIEARRDFCRRAWGMQVFSGPEIGSAINKDHTTVMYHCGLLKDKTPPEMAGSA